MGSFNREFQQGFTTDLPQIYQPFTKDLPKIRKYLAFYFLNIYQGFTTNLPMIYQRFTKSTKHLPTNYQQLTKIFFQFTNDLPQIFQHIFGVKYFLIFRKSLVNLCWNSRIIKIYSLKTCISEG